MLEQINIEVKEWDWKWQCIWSYKEWKKWLSVSTLLKRIETDYYKTKEVELSLDTIKLSWYEFWANNLFDFMTHYKLTENASLDFPIILNREWTIVDWRHRLCKAILQGDKTIKGIMILDSDIYE